MEDQTSLTWIVSITGMLISALVFLKDKMMSGIENLIHKLKKYKDKF